MPSVVEHLVIVPMAMITGVLPLAPNGLGTFEALVEFMYRQLMGASAIEGAGFIACLGYRLITVLIAVVGAVIYFLNRGEVTEAYHEGEVEAAEERQAAAS